MKSNTYKFNLRSNFENNITLMNDRVDKIFEGTAKTDLSEAMINTSLPKEIKVNIQIDLLSNKYFLSKYYSKLKIEVLTYDGETKEYTIKAEGETTCKENTPNLIATCIHSLFRDPLKLGNEIVKASLSSNIATYRKNEDNKISVFSPFRDCSKITDLIFTFNQLGYEEYDVVVPQYNSITNLLWV